MSNSTHMLSPEKLDDLSFTFSILEELLQNNLSSPKSIQYTKNKEYIQQLETLRKKVLKERTIDPQDVQHLSSIYKYVYGLEIKPDSNTERLQKVVNEFYSKQQLISLENELRKKYNQLNEGQKLKIVFMLGSGASQPKPSCIPTVNNMLPYLVSRISPTENPFADRVREWALKDAANIEDILTAGYLSTLLISKPIVNKLIGDIIYRELEEQTANLREREYVFSFQELTNRVFSMVSGLMVKADSNIVHETIAKLLNDFKGSNAVDFSVTTTNYDICMEKALFKLDLKYNYVGIEEKLEGTPIVKIHGSINWFYCEGCQSVITYSMDEIGAFKRIFPTIGSCQECGTATTLFMVPPIAYKYVMYPSLIDIWQGAMRTFEKADVIFVIGYSFSSSDDYFFKLMIKGLKKNSAILILNDISRKSIDNLEKKLTAYHLSPPITFEGDAAEAVPKIIDSIRLTIDNKKE